MISSTPKRKLDDARDREKGAPQEQTRSSADSIVRDVIQGLYEGRYVPGQRLVESSLTLHYGVSRSSVREALNRLAAERIVQLNLHRGAQIRLISRSEMHDILALLEVSIGLAARLAAERLHSPDDRLRFKLVLDQLLGFESRSESFDLLRARNKFYRALIESSRNGELERSLPTLHVHLVRLQYRTHGPAVAQGRFSDYRKIGEAVLAGEPRRAELAGRRHIRNIAATLEDLPNSAFGPG